MLKTKLEDIQSQEWNIGDITNLITEFETIFYKITNLQQLEFIDTCLNDMEKFKVFLNGAQEDRLISFQPINNLASAIYVYYDNNHMRELKNKTNIFDPCADSNQPLLSIYCMRNMYDAALWIALFSGAITIIVGLTAVFDRKDSNNLWAFTAVLLSATHTDHPLRQPK